MPNVQRDETRIRAAVSLIGFGMSERTVTRSLEADLEPEKILSVLNDPAQHGWCVTKNNESFNVQVNVSTAAGTVDFLREMAGGKRGGAYMRVFPRVLGGSVVVMTVPLAPGADPQQVAGVVDQELAALVSLSGKQRHLDRRLAG